MFTIYLHRNKINNKVYIGQTKRKPEDRWGPDGQGYKTQMFYKAIQKYGWDNFDHIILEQTPTQSEANILEEYYIKIFDSNNPKMDITYIRVEMQRLKQKKLNRKEGWPFLDLIIQCMANI